MLLLEHDGKELLARFGLPIAQGILATGAADIDAGSLPPGPWVVKVQVPTGGRGKAGGIRMADSLEEVKQHVTALVGTQLKGHLIRGCRVEQRIAGGTESYLSLSADGQSGGVRILMAAQGGVEIESMTDRVLSAMAAPEQAAITHAVDTLVEQMPARVRGALREAGTKIAEMFIRSEALLVEVNPLFIREDGNWLAGDAKVILDDNAFPRQPELVAMAHERREAYPETEFKLTEDFDYIDLDPNGQVGMVTTGAGLSMMLVDQLAQSELSAFNFVDIRTGQMKGDPHRLVLVFQRMKTGPHIKVLLINVFAGITHLGEFSRLLVEALALVPELGRMPIVARLLGNGLDEAREVLARANAPIFLETDLEEALARVAKLVKEANA